MLFSLMHVIHLVTIIIWIGGLAFITILILPMAIKMANPLEKVLMFQRIEKRFAPLARIYNLIAGASGFTMLFITGWHKIVFTKQGLPLLFMIIVWAWWAIMLFGLEPFIIKKMLEKLAKSGEKYEIEHVFIKMNRMHIAMLIVSLLAVIGGAAFAHGFFL